MAAQYEKDIFTTSFTGANNLVGQEGRLIDYAGVLTANNTQVAKGVVRVGYGANLASELIIKGECMAYVTIGANAATTVGQKLASSANGALEAHAGTVYVRAVCMEANNSANNTVLLRVNLL